MSKASKKKGCSTKVRRYNQCEQWKERFHELLEYRKIHGHCSVPYKYPKNPLLAGWVKRQRYQYSLMKKGKKSFITDKRIKILNDIGFVWNSQEVSWQERFKELQEFRARYGHGFIPLTFPPNPQLATWAKCQRRQRKLYLEGKPAFINAERILALENVGFEWSATPKNRSRYNWSPLNKAPRGPAPDEAQYYDLMLEVLSILSDDSSKKCDSFSSNQSQSLLGREIQF